MEAQKLTEVCLCALTGISQGHINVLKNGRKLPTLRTAYRIAIALGVTVEAVWPASIAKTRAA